MRVLELTDLNFANHVCKHEYAVVLYYSKQFQDFSSVMAAYEQLAVRESGQSNMAFYKLNAHTCPVVRVHEAIYALPLVAVYQFGKPTLKKIIDRPEMLLEVIHDLAVAM